jgi:neutral ceramidase
MIPGDTMTDLKAGFAKIDVTPALPVSLAGYFNRRPAREIMDPLFTRIAVIERRGETLVFVQIDTCALPAEDVDALRSDISSRTGYPGESIMVFVSHIHTGPDLIGLFGLPRELAYLQKLKTQIVEAVASIRPEIPVDILIGRGRTEGLSFNRRWFLDDGSLVTNPPKRHPSRQRPEGPVDPEIRLVAFRDPSGTDRALFVNVSNHTDTIGDDVISADWPGFMERDIAAGLGRDLPVFPLIAPQGNINHFDFDDGRGQTSYAEAERLGAAYAAAVRDLWPAMRRIPIDRITSDLIAVPIPPRKVEESDIRWARGIIACSKGEQGLENKDLTSEDLAKGNPAVERIFAENLLRFVEEKPLSYPVHLQVFSLGKVVFAAIPAEPFVELGLDIMAIDGFSLVIPIALANGYYGYLPVEEAFERGGYETRPGVSSRLDTGAARTILTFFRDRLSELRERSDRDEQGEKEAR